MAKKKKKKDLGPKRKRMERSTRLIHAKEWVKSYEGKNIIKGYAKWYGVDYICALTELEMIGYPISESMKEKTKKAIKDRKHQKKIQKEKRKQKRAQLEDEWDFDSDENFAFIVGYTSGGAPYGITHEEWALLEEEEQSKTHTQKSIAGWESEEPQWDEWEQDEMLGELDNLEYEIFEEEAVQEMKEPEYLAKLSDKEIADLLKLIGSNKNVMIID